MAFNPVKDAELCSVSSDGTVKFWDVRTKNCFNEVRGLGEAFTLAWAPSGDTLIVGNKVSEELLLFIAAQPSPTDLALTLLPGRQHLRTFSDPEYAHLISPAATPNQSDCLLLERE